MYTVFVIGTIASGKSTAARYFERLGARRIDLDRFAKDLYVPGSELVDELAAEFGVEVITEDGGIDAKSLAARAFETAESTARLNEIVHPVLRDRLTQMLLPVPCVSMAAPRYPFTVIEASVPEAVRDLFQLADEVLAIVAPIETRRSRAIERGMDPADFDRRAALQPSDEEIAAMATAVIENTFEDEDGFTAALGHWLVAHGVAIDLDDAAVPHA